MWIIAAARAAVFLFAFTLEAPLDDCSSASLLATHTVLCPLEALSSSSSSECMVGTLMVILLLWEVMEGEPEGWSTCWVRR